MGRVNREQKDLSHFRIETSVGKGGFGKVNCVTELKTGRLFAMKTLNKARCFELESGVNQASFPSQPSPTHNSGFSLIISLK